MGVASSGFLHGQAADPPSLYSLSIEELMEIKVHLVSRQEDSVFRSPAAIFVVTNEDIMSSGMQSIPELLRLVPGAYVAQTDSNKWSISLRGFSSRFSQKLLVLMDGRSLYTPLFSGTYWDVQDTVLEDIDRIEIIRGPGASLWGANAVNGIINIVTKSAEDTLGTLAWGGISTDAESSTVGLRHGFRAGAFSVRVFTQYDTFGAGEVLGDAESPNSGLLDPGSDGDDDWSRFQTGFRADGILAGTSLTLIGNYYEGDFGQTRILQNPDQSRNAEPDRTKADGWNLLARWQNEVTDSFRLQAQAYYDFTYREDAALQEDRKTFDFDLQGTLDLDSRWRQQWTGGIGFRETSDDILALAMLLLDPDSRSDTTFSAFLQNEVEFKPDQLQVTLGTKFEHNDYTGSEWQPTVRLLSVPRENLSVWAAVTRAVRVPSRFDADAAIELSPGVILPIGNPSGKASVLHAYEIGTRWLMHQNLSLDGTVFLHDYSDLIRFDNGGEATTVGTEWTLTWNVLPVFQVKANYSLHRGEDSRPESNSTAFDVMPRHLGSLRCAWQVRPHWEIDVSQYLVSKARITMDRSIEGYYRLDVRLAWKPQGNWSLEIVGQNLTDDVHVEDYESIRLNTGVERSVHVLARFRY